MALEALKTRFDERVERYVWRRSTEADNILNLALLEQNRDETVRQFRSKVREENELAEIHAHLEGVLSLVYELTSDRVQFNQNGFMQPESPPLNKHQIGIVTLFSVVGKLPTSPYAANEDQIAVAGRLLQVPHFDEDYVEENPMQEAITAYLHRGVIREKENCLFLTDKLDESFK